MSVCVWMGKGWGEGGMGRGTDSIHATASPGFCVYVRSSQIISRGERWCGVGWVRRSGETETVAVAASRAVRAEQTQGVSQWTRTFPSVVAGAGAVQRAQPPRVVSSATQRRSHALSTIPLAIPY